MLGHELRALDDVLEVALREPLALRDHAEAVRAAASAALACSRIWSGDIIACIGVSASAYFDCAQKPQSSAQPPDFALTSEQRSVESPKRSVRAPRALDQILDRGVILDLSECEGLLASDERRQVDPFRRRAVSRKVRAPSDGRFRSSGGLARDPGPFQRAARLGPRRLQRRAGRVARRRARRGGPPSTAAARVRARRRAARGRVRRACWTGGRSCWRRSPRRWQSIRRHRSRSTRRARPRRTRSSSMTASFPDLLRVRTERAEGDGLRLFAGPVADARCSAPRGFPPLSSRRCHRWSHCSSGQRSIAPARRRR